MRTIYLITNEDGKIAAAAGAMAKDYEVRREVMQMALQRYAVYRIEIFMETLRTEADTDKDFDLRFVNQALAEWKHNNPYGDTRE
mgnify:CR=1 FL=1